MDKHMEKGISLEKQLSKLFGGIYLVLCLIVLLALSISIVNYQKDNTAFFAQEINAYKEEVEEAIQQINSVVSYIYLENTAFAKIPYENNELELYKLTYQLADDMELLINANQGIEGIFIYYNDCEDVIYQMANTITINQRKQIFDNHTSILDQTASTRGYVIQEIEGIQYYTIYYIKDGTAVLGLIDIEESIRDVEEVIQWKGNLKGITAQGAVVVSIGEASILNNIPLDTVEMGASTQGNIDIYMEEVEGADLKVFAIVPYSIWNELSKQHVVILILLLLSSYPAIKIYNLIRRQIMAPLADLVKVMNEIQKGNWNVNFSIHTNFEEINSVKKALVIMVDEIESLKIEAYEEKNKKQYAELQYFQLQLSPHFYINCLKLIQAKIQMGYTQEADDFLVQLSLHFRYLMANATRKVRVSDEMKFVNNYLNLTKDMVSDNINACIYIDSAAREKEVPLLSVQTFVENSVKYARKNSEQVLFLDIQVKYMKVGEGEFINIIVKDDGIGYPPLSLEVLNGIEENEEMGVGIANLKKRIELIYQTDYSWYFYNQHGAVSELVLPIHVEG